MSPNLERKNVTICIAAICEAAGQRRIVLCTDTKISTQLGSAETAHKQRAVAKNLVGLFAGEESEAIALYLCLKKHLRPAAKLDETNIKPMTEAALDERRAQMIERLVQGRFAISYREFLEHGKERLPTDQFQRTADEIANLTLKAECILAGFIADMPMLVTTDRHSVAKIQDHFAAAGEGRYLAEAALSHRAQQETKRFGETLYNVYEAKRYAQRIGSVGEFTVITVLHEDKVPQVVLHEGLVGLGQMYEKYGPQPVPPQLQIPENFLTILESGMDGCACRGTKQKINAAALVVGTEMQRIRNGIGDAFDPRE